MGELDGKVALVTGANTGIGRVAAIELARKGARMILAGRSEERTRPVVDEIRAACGENAARFVRLDLSSLKAVDQAADEVLAIDEPLHLLINNAGLAAAKGHTEDGFELAFGVNHMGHFRLTQRLLDRVADSGGGRIVTVASDAHKRVDGIDFEAVRRPTATPTGFPEYCVSKLANVLFSAELARRCRDRDVHTYALHPGVVATDVWRQLPWPIRPLVKLFMRSEEEGASTTIHCASSSELASHTGRYYVDCREKKPGPAGRNQELAEDLWQRSEAWCEAFAARAA